MEAEIATLRRASNKHEQIALMSKLELKKCRSELASLQKEHERDARTIEWLQAEKKAADARAETDKALIKKLEIRLAAADSLDAIDQVAALKREVRQLTDQLGEARERSTRAAQQSDRRGEEVVVLRRALEVRAAELQVPGDPSAGAPARMLYALAKSREDAIALAVSYAEAREDLARARRLLEGANRQVGVLAEERETASRRILELEDDCRRHDERRARFESEIRGLEGELRSLQARSVAQEREKANLRQDIELMRGRAEGARREGERRELEGRGALERVKEEAGRALKAEGDRWVAEMARMEAELQASRAEARELQSRLRACEGERAQELGSLAAQATALRQQEAALGDKEAARRLREHALGSEVAALHAQCDALAEENLRLQALVGEGRRGMDAESGRAGRLADLEGELGALRAQRQEGEALLRGRLEAALGTMVWRPFFYSLFARRHLLCRTARSQSQPSPPQSLSQPTCGRRWLRGTTCGPRWWACGPITRRSCSGCRR